MTASEWARERFGEAAGELREAISVAIPRAHRFAVAAQAAGGTTKKDPYGHTLKNRQHECLVEAARDIPGVEAFRPHGASFELLRVPATKAVLFPWRYASDGSVPREKARMRTSGFRRDLLSGVTGMPGQLTIEHASMAHDELEAELAEADDLLEQLRALARVVTIGYASNPNAILDLGWGDADLVDDSHLMQWRHWESLPVLTGAGHAQQGPDVSGLRAAPGDAAPLHGPRFNDMPLDDDFGLRPRNRLSGEPQQETEPAALDTGTEDKQP